MLLPDLSEWTIETVCEIADPAFDEGLSLEKKASAKFDCASSFAKKSTIAEVAKQVCAFANAGGGFVVFGVRDAKAGGGIDEGVPEFVGNQACKEWIETQIPQRCSPPITGVTARFITYPNSEAGALIIHIPTSEGRPHWIVENKTETPYLRVGGQSAPMSLRTALDMFSRGSSPSVVIEEFSTWSIKRLPTGAGSYEIRPRIKLISGHVIHKWVMEVEIDSAAGRLGGSVVDRSHIDSISQSHLVIRSSGVGPLYPGRPTEITVGHIRLYHFAPHNSSADHDPQLKLTLYGESLRPVTQSISLKSVFPT